MSPSSSYTSQAIQLCTSSTGGYTNWVAGGTAEVFATFDPAIEEQLEEALAALFGPVEPEGVEGANFSLAGLYMHFQIGEGKPLYINMLSVDFGSATQEDLGLVGMQPGDVRAVNLFNAGTLNEAALAFGNVNMKYHGNNQFSIVGDENSRFDFWPLVGGSSLTRDAGNLLGAAINYNLFISPAAILFPIIFGGTFDVNFIGTTIIPK